MDDDLIEEAEELGINTSMYYLLPPKQREKALRRDIIRAKAGMEDRRGKNRQNEGA